MYFTKEEIAQIRAETRGTSHVTHFNNAGAALMPDLVTDAVIEYTKTEAIMGGYETAALYAPQINHVYQAIGQLINAGREEIAIVENATVAWQLAFHSCQFEAGDIILTAKSSYASNYISYLQLEKKKGVQIQVIPNDEHGQVDIAALESMISEKVKLISVTHIPTNGGLINPVEAVGKIANQHNILYLVDACQSVGQVPIDVQAIGCDFLSATGRKYLRAPRGTGFLFVKKALLDAGLEPLFIDLHGATWTAKNEYQLDATAKRFENWERNYANIFGLTVAVEYALSIGIERIAGRIAQLGNYLRTQLAQVPSITVYDLGVQKGGLVSFSIEGLGKYFILGELAKHKINVSPIFRNGTLLDSEERGLSDEMVRASVHYYNTEEEIDRFCEVIQQLNSEIA